MLRRKLTGYIQSLSLARMLQLSYLLLLAAVLVISGSFMVLNLSNLSVEQTNRYTLSSLNDVNEQIADKIGLSPKYLSTSRRTTRWSAL
jgi:hypothetical protein